VVLGQLHKRGAYKWVRGDTSLRRSRRRALAALIAYLFRKHHGSCGSPRIHADLIELGWRVSRNTVAKLMAEQGLVARPKRRRRGLTRADKSARKAADALNRDFTPPDRPNVRWVGDLTDLPNEEGKFYLAAILDLHSRRCVGFAMSGKTTTIRLLAGLLRPTSGRAEVLGMDTVRERDRMQRRIGYLPGEFVAYPDLTSEQYLRYLAKPARRRVAGRADRQAARPRPHRSDRRPLARQPAEGRHRSGEPTAASRRGSQHHRQRDGLRPVAGGERHLVDLRERGTGVGFLPLYPPSRLPGTASSRWC
jgi:hypothetical protein